MRLGKLCCICFVILPGIGIAQQLTQQEPKDASQGRATKYLCERGAEKRGVEVVYTEPEAKLPCKVVQHYHLGDDKNHKQVDKFWAKHTPHFCEEKANWLAMSRLKSLKWKCKGVESL